LFVICSVQQGKSKAKMKKNSKNLSASVQSQLSQQQATPLSTLTLEELESVGSGGRAFEPTKFNYDYLSQYMCLFCDWDGLDS
jgi:hypothetical protein